MTTHKLWIALWLAVSLVFVGCGESDSSGGFAVEDDEARNNGSDFPDAGATDTGNQQGDATDTFVPEEEEFLVREVAATSSLVFVPNSSPQSDTVARIDARNFSVRPVQVGQQPTAVRAATVEEVGDVAYVLCEGSSAVAIIRPGDDEDRVTLLPVPDEVNALTISPDGRHALAYIDPDKPIDSGSSVASLQTLGLVRLGDTPEGDEVHHLSVTRLISDIEFTEDGSEGFLVGREGINRLRFDEIESDTFVPPLGLALSESVFPPDDLEVEVAADGSYLVARSSEFSGVALFRPATEDDEATTRMIELDAIPTDIDLYTDDDGSPGLIASLRGAGGVALLDVDSALAGDPAEDVVTFVEATGANPGLAQLTPQQDQVLLYTTLVTRPRLGLLDLEAEEVTTYLLRNQIRSVAVSHDGKTAVVVHRKQEGDPPTDADPLTFFQHNHGLTLFDFETGYLRPVTLQAEPVDLVLTQTSEDVPLVYVMLQSDDPRKQGVERMNLSTYRTDFMSTARKPQQIGRVGDKIFVNQASEEGRITFIDVETGAARTVSGYELNAGID